MKRQPRLPKRYLTEEQLREYAEEFARIAGIPLRGVFTQDTMPSEEPELTEAGVLVIESGGERPSTHTTKKMPPRKGTDWLILEKQGYWVRIIHPFGKPYDSNALPTKLHEYFRGSQFCMDHDRYIQLCNDMF